MEWTIQAYRGLLQHCIGLFTGTSCSSMQRRATSQALWLWMTSPWVLSALALVSWELLLFVAMELNMLCYTTPLDKLVTTDVIKKLTIIHGIWHQEYFGCTCLLSAWAKVWRLTVSPPSHQRINSLWWRLSCRGICHTGTFKQFYFGKIA